MLLRWIGVTFLFYLCNTSCFAETSQNLLLSHYVVPSPKLLGEKNNAKEGSALVSPEVKNGNPPANESSPDLSGKTMTPSEKNHVAEREIAITIDDLPFVGSGTSTPGNLKRTQERFMAIVKALVDNQVPATGFAIGGAVAKNEWELLETFRNQGFFIGNHTYTHKSLNTMSAEKYIAEIGRADTILAPVITEPKYFRYPYLAEGTGKKKQQVIEYLTAHQYTIAPVTIDSKDYEFNAQFYRIPYRKRAQSIHQFKKRYLAYIWKQTVLAEQRAKKIANQPVKQILLIHANLLNSLCLEDIINLYKKNGYKFISLTDALKGNTAQALKNEPEAPHVAAKLP